MAADASAIEIVMPRMGLTMEEGTVVSWLKAVGEPVKAGEPLLEIETDKATVEIESPRDGVLSQVIVAPGVTVPIGAVIAYLSPAGASIPAGVTPAAQVANLSPAQPVTSSWPSSPTPSTAPAETGKVRASPAARRLARQLGVDLARVQPSGPGGRVVAWNVEAASRSQAPQPDQSVSPSVAATPVAQRAAQELGVPLAGLQGSGPGRRLTRQDVERAALARSLSGQVVPQSAQVAFPGGRVEPFSRIQKVMAERMASSFHTAPHFYLHVEADARPMLALRQSLLPRLEDHYGVHLTLTDLLVKFSALALQRHPEALAQWTESGLLQPQQVNIGVAADTPHGLLVPVIRNCNQLSLSDIVRQRAALVEKARLGKLTPDELEMGVFTITNLGTLNIDFFDAILNPPQAAILSVGRIKERPWVDAGQVIAAPTLMLSLSVDHRVLDGAAAARFLGNLLELVETPGLALG